MSLIAHATLFTHFFVGGFVIHPRKIFELVELNLLNEIRSLHSEVDRLTS